MGKNSAILCAKRAFLWLNSHENLVKTAKIEHH